MRKFIIILFFTSTILISGCKVSYSFSGTSIQPDVKTFTVEYFENKAQRIYPSLANSLTEELIDKYTKLTKLKMQSERGDLIVSGIITGYETRPMAVTADEVASQNRLTITVKVTFTNTLHPDENFEKSFAGYSDYDSMQSLDSVESTLCDTIIEIIIEDIFNATVANW